MRKKYFLLISVILLFIAGCSANNQNLSNSENNQITGNKVEIKNFAFYPSELTINAGETVTWINKDGVKHTVTSDSGNELSSTLLSTSETYSHAFNTPGEYMYHCNLHQGMSGKIIVE